jgi:hypothetical protein
MQMRWCCVALMVAALFSPTVGLADPVLPRQALLEGQDFWDNRDWDWYQANIPFFECPDPDIQTTYYYRWELLTKHLTYGSPNSGYSFTEFIDRPFWSGAYGAISCPAGLHLYEARWLRNPRFATDYARYWFRTPGAQPRNYSTWLADSVWAVHQVHPNEAFAKDLLPDLRKNYEAWEKRHFVPDVGLFWQTGHDDGMEFNINSRQTKDILRGAPSYRPTINAYMWADAQAIARIADLAGEKSAGDAYRKKAASLRDNLHAKLWDPKRQFFFPMYQRDEEAEGHKVKALSLTYQSGRHAGSEYGRELIGYVPWQFGMVDAGKGYEAAWKKLTDAEGFAAPFGPTTVERNDPMFLLKKSCCWWSGQSWPYATSQTLTALAKLLHNYDQSVVSASDYVELLKTFARTHRKNGKPYLAEACNPDTGSFEGHDGYNHSEHYFHSSFNDLVITGLIGLQTRDDDVLEVKPLAPKNWRYFAVDAVPYRGHEISVLWDRDGTRYGKGKGLHLLADGKVIGSSETLGPLSARLPTANRKPAPDAVPINYAVNNDGDYFPRLTAGYSAPRTPLARLNDGNYWYAIHPPNRWTTEGSTSASDDVVVDFGTPRSINTAKFYFLDDGKGIVPPTSYALESWNGMQWTAIPDQNRTPQKPEGKKANVVAFSAITTSKVRVQFQHAAQGKTGLTELELWGAAVLPLDPPPHPKGNLAYNPGNRPFPKASASHFDRFGGKPALAIDGKTNFLPTPTNRWTSYESPNPTDWLEVDFGETKAVTRVELAIYDDRGGVQPPLRYEVETWNGTAWAPVAGAKMTPERPAGSQFNEVRFDRVETSKVRVVFTHAGKARSGVSEILIWGN